MARDKDYIEVDAVIRMPKGGRLADSKKTRGWSRGFTPRSTERGPEHVEIRLKEAGEEGTSETTPIDPSPSSFNSYFEPRPQRTPEQEKLDELLELYARIAAKKAVEWAEPRLERLWSERVVPFVGGKWNQ